MLLFNREFVSFFFISAFFLFLIGCGDDGIRDGGNLSPQIFVFEAKSDIVEPGTQIPVTIEAGDLEGDPVDFPMV